MRTAGAVFSDASLLDQVALRPLWLPAQVVAKRDTTAAPTRLVAIDRTALPAGASVDAAGAVSVPLGVAAAAITGVTRNGAPFANAGQFALAGGSLVVNPSLMAQPPAGTVDTYVVGVGDTGGGSTLVTVKVSHGSVRIDSITMAAALPPTASPVPSVAPGSYGLDQSVSLSCPTAVPNCTLRYTVDGSTPTVASPLLTAPLAVTAAAGALATTTVKVLLFDALGVAKASVDSFAYAIDKRAPTGAPVPSVTPGTYGVDQSVSFSCPTTVVGGCTLRYTLDGSTPTAASPVLAGALNVGAALGTSATTTIKLLVFNAAGVAKASVDGFAYTIDKSPPTAAPVASVAPGTYGSDQGVSFSCPAAVPGCALRYTTDGSTPTAASPLLSGPVSLVAPAGASATTTLKLLLFNAVGVPKASADGFAYTIDKTVPTASPVASITPGTYGSDQSVSFSCPASLAGCTLHYTTDGSTPTTNSPLLTGALNVTAPAGASATTTIKVLLFNALGTPKASADGFAYTIDKTVPTASPVASVAPGTYGSDQSVSFACPAAAQGCTLRYTTDGSTPTIASPVLAGAVSISAPNGGAATTTIKILLVNALGVAKASVDSFSYTVDKSPPPNQAPSFATPPVNQTVGKNTASAVNIVVADAETTAAALVVTASSSDQAIVRNADIAVTAGGGGARTITVTPQAGATGTVTVNVAVSDGTVATNASYTITFVNAAPTLAAQGDLNWTQNQAVNVVLSAGSDTDAGDTLTYSIVGGALPAGVSFTAATRTLAGTPTAVQGATAVTYRVTDGSGAWAERTFSITVNAGNSAPTANDFTYGTAIGNGARTFDWKTLSAAADADGDALSASVTANGAKGGCVIAGDNLTYTPAANQGGGDSCTLQIADGRGGTVSKTVSVTGIDTAAPATPTLALADGDAGNGTGSAGYTNSTAVTVAIGNDTDNVGVAGWYVSENGATPAAAAGGWVGARPTTATLSAGDGVKTVHVWTKDAAGNVSERGSGTIELGTVAPSSAAIVSGLVDMKNTTYAAVTLSGDQSFASASVNVASRNGGVLLGVLSINGSGQIVIQSYDTPNANPDWLDITGNDKYGNAINIAVRVNLPN